MAELQAISVAACSNISIGVTPALCIGISSHISQQRTPMTAAVSNQPMPARTANKRKPAHRHGESE